MTILALDPGFSGGVCVMAPSGAVEFAKPMPMAGGELDLAAIADLLRFYSPTLCVIEKVGAMPKQGVVSTFRFGAGYGMLLGICAGMRVPAQLVTPQAWKKIVLAGTEKDKDAAIAYVRRVYPNVQLVQPKCRKPHDGVADAVCLADYARRTYQPKGTP